MEIHNQKKLKDAELLNKQLQEMVVVLEKENEQKGEQLLGLTLNTKNLPKALMDPGQVEMERVTMSKDIGKATNFMSMMPKETEEDTKLLAQKLADQNNQLKNLLQENEKRLGVALEELKQKSKEVMELRAAVMDAINRSQVV
jgi:ribosome-binding factor A